MPKTITVTVVHHGEREEQVDADRYRLACETGRLDTLFGPDRFDVEHTVTVVEPDGTSRDVLDPDAAPRLTLLAASRARIGTGVTDTITKILAAARPHPDCAPCNTGTGTCRRHLAEAVVDAVRQDSLMIATPDLADTILRRFAADALTAAAADVAHMFAERLNRLADPGQNTGS